MVRKALVRVVAEGLESQEMGKFRKLRLLNPIIGRRKYIYIIVIELSEIYSD
jgi:hypothetical protein